MSLNIQKMIEIGDSLIILSRFINIYPSNDIKLAQIIKRIFNMIYLIPQNKCFHVLRGNNSVVDEIYNLGGTLPKGYLVRQGHIKRAPIP